MSPRIRFDLTVNEFTKELALNRELVIFGEQFWRPYCHVYDLSRAVSQIFDTNNDIVSFNVYNVGDTSENYQKQMIVDEILKQIPNSKIRYVKKDEDPREKLFKYAVKSKWVITEMSPHGVDLESIFRTLTMEGKINA